MKQYNEQHDYARESLIRAFRAFIRAYNDEDCSARDRGLAWENLKEAMAEHDEVVEASAVRGPDAID